MTMVEINLSTYIEVDHEVDMHYHVGNDIQVYLVHHGLEFHTWEFLECADLGTR